MGLGVGGVGSAHKPLKTTLIDGAVGVTEENTTMKLRALTLSLVFLMEHDTVSVCERRIILRVSITTRKKNGCHSFTSHYIPI